MKRFWYTVRPLVCFLLLALTSYLAWRWAAPRYTVEQIGNFLIVIAKVNVFGGVLFFLVEWQMHTRREYPKRKSVSPPIKGDTL